MVVELRNVFSSRWLIFLNGSCSLEFCVHRPRNESWQWPLKTQVPHGFSAFLPGMLCRGGSFIPEQNTSPFSFQEQRRSAHSGWYGHKCTSPFRWKLFLRPVSPFFSEQEQCPGQLDELTYQKGNYSVVLLRSSMAIGAPSRSLPCLLFLLPFSLEFHWKADLACHSVDMVASLCRWTKKLMGCSWIDEPLLLRESQVRSFSSGNTHLPTLGSYFLHWFVCLLTKNSVPWN